MSIFLMVGFKSGKNGFLKFYNKLKLLKKGGSALEPP